MADALTQLVKIKWVDSDGKIGSSAFSVTLDAATNPLTRTVVTDIVTATRALTNCKITGEIGQTSENELVGVAAAANYNARDKMKVVYVDGQNVRHALDIPDPLPTMFTAPAYEYVDESVTAWDDLVTSIEGNVVGKDGNGVTVLYGYRSRSRRLRPGSKKFS